MKRAVPMLLVLLLVASACSSDPGTDAATESAAEPVAATEPADAPEPTPSPTPTVAPEPTSPPEPTATPAAEPLRRPLDVLDPGDAGSGIVSPVNSAPLPDGFTETEYVFGGEAVSFTEISDLAPDGLWEVTEGSTAPYRTRMIVRRPPAEAFSGTVLVEWFNVTSGADLAPDWGFLAEEIGRSGHVWVGVSAQEVGINGRDGEFIGGGLIDTRGLKIIDPERYGDLDHPGDAFSFDIFSQAGALVSDAAGGTDVLAGLAPDRVIALGESQSAGFLTTYVNAVHGLTGVFDGFLIHSRGSFGPTPSGDRLGDDEAAVRVRTDLEEPVLMYETETDLIGLGYAAARQDDTDMVRTWEVAGTAHADVYSIVVGAGLPRQPEIGALIGCDTPINDGPQHATLQAALRHLVAWVADGTLPPESPRIEVADDAIVRDELGIALGGIRTPPVDAPLRVLSGDPGPDGGACFLFGQTLPLPADVLGGLYTGVDDYVSALKASAAAAVEAGWLLPEDAAVMIAEETARAEQLLGSG